MSPLLPGVTVREATQADAAVLTGIERRCPIRLGERLFTIDRGDDYFAFARLMEEVTVALGLVDGVPAAINCGAVHPVHIGGQERRVMTAIHSRILPEHQRRGLWGAVSELLVEKYPIGSAIDGRLGWVALENEAMIRAFAARRSFPWRAGALRLQLPCDALAGPPSGRPASPDDAGRIAEILNAYHAGAEIFRPYTAGSLAARVERAPRDYGWGHVWLGDGAVVGVWPAGRSLRVISESREEGRRESRRGLVLDHGCLPGAERELEALLRARCAELTRQGLDTLSLFSRPAAAGFAGLRAMAASSEQFALFSGFEEPLGAEQSGLYVDPIYF